MTFPLPGKSGSLYVTGFIAKSTIRFPTLDFGQAVADLLQNLYPKALPPFHWRPSLELGVKLCHGLTSLHFWELDSAKLYDAYTILATTSKGAQGVKNTSSTSKSYQQLGLWEGEDALAPAELGSDLEKHIFTVSEVTGYGELSSEFERLVRMYYAKNSRSFEVKATGHNQFMLNLSNSGEAMAQPAIETDIPARVLTHFRTARDLSVRQVRTAQITLLTCALQAYSSNVSAFKTIPDWELVTLV